MFVYFLSERERASEQAWEGQTEREREREISSRFRTVNAEPSVGLKLTNCEIMA